MAFTILPEIPSFANAINASLVATQQTADVLSMSSKEIADLTGKQHAHVIRDIKVMFSQIYSANIDDPNLDHADCKGVSVEKDNRGYVANIHLDKDHTLTLLTGYDAGARIKVVRRWQELELHVRGVVPPHAQMAIQASVQAAQCVAPFMDAAKAFGFEGNQAILSANRAVKRVVGVDVLDLMGQKALVAPDQEILLTVTEIEQRFGWKRQEGNKKLTAMGLQTEYRDNRKKLCYELTDEGRKYGVYLDTGKQHGNGTPIRQLKWKESVLAALKAADTFNLSFMTGV